MILQLKSWLLSLCTAAIAGEIVLFLAPAKRMNSLLAVVVNVFFLTAFLSPLLFLREKGDFMPSLDLSTASKRQTEALEQTVGEQYTETVRDNLTQILTQRLSAIEVTPEKIDFQIHTDENESIWINQVLLTLDGEYEAREEEIKQQVANLLGYETRVIMAYRE